MYIAEDWSCAETISKHEATICTYVRTSLHTFFNTKTQLFHASDRSWYSSSRSSRSSRSRRGPYYILCRQYLDPVYLVDFTPRKCVRNIYLIDLTHPTRTNICYVDHANPVRDPTRSICAKYLDPIDQTREKSVKYIY